MRISHRYKFVFFASPKTGSSTVRQFLDPYTDVMPSITFKSRTPENPFYPHMRPVEAKQCFDRYGWDFDGYTKFVCVRNPWARLVSLFHHVYRNASPPPFDDWIRSVQPFGAGARGDDAERWRKYGSYSIEHFIKDESGGILVDKVIRTEEIDRTLTPYLRALGIPVRADQRLPCRNVTGSGRRYVDYYTRQTADRVRWLYRYDIASYGYEFGDPA
jgi:Sulfotransferase family